MESQKIKEIQGMIKRHQETIQPQPRDIPVSAGRLSDDLSKVASNDVIGKGGDSDLLK
jgi:hypothetical protein